MRTPLRVRRVSVARQVQELLRRERCGAIHAKLVATSLQETTLRVQTAHLDDTEMVGKMRMSEIAPYAPRDILKARVALRFVWRVLLANIKTIRNNSNAVFVL